MSLLMLDVLIWPMILAGAVLILTCVGIVGLAVFFAVRILRREKRNTTESNSLPSAPSAEDSKD